MRANAASASRFSVAAFLVILWLTVYRMLLRQVTRGEAAAIYTTVLLCAMLPGFGVLLTVTPGAVVPKSMEAGFTSISAGEIRTFPGQLHPASAKRANVPNHGRDTLM